MEFFMALVFSLIAIFFSGGNGKNTNNQQNQQTNNPPPPPAIVSLGNGTGNAPNGQSQTPPPTAVPTPALLPGLIGLGVAALRKHHAAKDETSV